MSASTAARVLAVALVLMICRVSPAGIRWTTNYDTALRRSKRSGKPVMLWFMDGSIGWCSRFERTTLSDDAVVDLSRKFVCLQIDRRLKPRLAERFMVKKVSDTRFLNREGKEIGRVLGNVKARTFKPAMERVLKKVGRRAPSGMYSAAGRALDEALKSYEKGRYSASFRRLTWVEGLGTGGDETKKMTSHFLRKIEKLADSRFVSAESMLREGKIEEGMKALSDLRHEFKGTECDRRAGDLLSLLRRDTAIRESLAKKRIGAYTERLLRGADAAFRNDRYLAALEGYRVLASRYGDTAAGYQAAVKLRKIEKSRRVMSQVAGQRRDGECLERISMARSWIMNGDTEKARTLLRDVAEKYPGTKLGRHASNELAKLEEETGGDRKGLSP